MECAPGTLTGALLESLLRCGVNRVSLGVQSFVDAEAAAVGRLHKRATVLEDIARLRAAGITNINIDLIAGLPHQTSESWQFSLAETIATGAPHVSVYMLEVDEDSRLGRELWQGARAITRTLCRMKKPWRIFIAVACDELAGGGDSAIRDFQLRARGIRVAAQFEVLDAATLFRLRRGRAFDAAFCSSRLRGGAICAG